MAEVLFWKCEECLLVGPEAGFRDSSGYLCSRCQSEDVFPYRHFKCKKCGHIADQDTWFPEFPADDNPLNHDVEAKPCQKCVEKLEDEISQGRRRFLSLAEEKEIEDLANQPAKLEEVPVVLDNLQGTVPKN